MSRWREAAVITALSAAILVTPPASAQERRAQPVVGGGSLNTAPSLEPGSYSDTILPGESTYYRVELDPGQSLRVMGTFDKTAFPLVPTRPGFEPGVHGMFHFVAVYTPLRQEIAEQIAATEGVGRVARATVETDEALTYESLLDGEYTQSEFLGPGAYYIRLSALDLIIDAPPVELPTEIDVRVRGASRDPDYDAAELVPPEPDGEQGDADEEASEGGSDDDIGDLAIVGVLALLGGTALGAVGTSVARRA
jgi:Ca-activated chloride channel family protein